MKNFLFRLTHPEFWVTIRPVSKDWDKWMNEALDKEDPIRTGIHTAELDGKIIWISNYPYAFGLEYGSYPEFIPEPLTRLRLAKILGYVAR